MNKDAEVSPLDDWIEAGPEGIDDESLRDWLAEDPDARMRELVEASLREQQLRDVVRAEFTERKVQAEAGSAQSKVVAFPVRRAVALGIAALLVFGFFLNTLLEPDRGASGAAGVVATVLVSDGAILEGGGKTVVEGESIRLDAFSLQEGSLELALTSDVTVELFAPLEGRFVDAMRLELGSGRLNAEVGERGKGFTVVTDAGEVIDLGTRFGVEAERNGEARVAVFSGVVEFHPKGGGEKGFVTLTEGESLRFSVVNGLRRWQQVALAAEKAGLTGKPNSGVLRRVRDNQGELDEDGSEIKPFYGVVSGGMRDGVLAFTDKPGPHYRAYPGEEFPEELIGADLVRTYFYLRKKKDYELTLSLAEEAEVYLFLLSPSEVPAWVEELGFERTGDRLLAGPWHWSMREHPGAVLIDEDPHLTFDVWKSRVGAGDLTLGALLRPGRGEQFTSYGVAVKPLNP